MELEQYKDVLQFIPEYQLTMEPLQIDIVIIKKTEDIIIKKNIGAMFRKDNLVEFKSPGCYISVKDFYKTYGYACLYAYLTEVPITELTISFVEHRYPRKLISHLEKIRDFKVAEKNPGIYTVMGDIIPMQIIDSRKLSDDENLWLKNLSNKLDVPEIRKIEKELEQNDRYAKMRAYMDAISRANPKKVKEAIKMSKSTLTLEQVFIDVGWTAKWEVKTKLEVAKKALAEGLSEKTIAAITGLKPKAIKELAEK
jgi:hypothetical protein